MSVKQENTDLCAVGNECLLEDSVALFKKMFQLKQDPQLYYFFSTKSVLKLLFEWGSIGIKVEPALVHIPSEERIDITMVLKPLIHPTSGYNGTALNNLFSEDEIERLMQILELEPNTLGGRDSTVCCPTPGKPIDYPKRKEKLTIWIDNLTKFRDSL